MFEQSNFQLFTNIFGWMLFGHQAILLALVVALHSISLNNTSTSKTPHTKVWTPYIPRLNPRGFTGYWIKYFLESDKDLKSVAIESLRNTALRERHSKKLRTLLETIQIEGPLDKPRVNETTGKILKERASHSQIPLSILRLALSRRNAIVHGGGDNKVSDRDMNT